MASPNSLRSQRRAWLPMPQWRSEVESPLYSVAARLPLSRRHNNTVILPLPLFVDHDRDVHHCCCRNIACRDRSRQLCSAHKSSGSVVSVPLHDRIRGEIRTSDEQRKVGSARCGCVGRENAKRRLLAITEKRIFLDVRREDWDSTFRKAGQVLLETTLSTTKRFTRYRCPNIPLGDVATEKSVGEP